MGKLLLDGVRKGDLFIHDIYLLLSTHVIHCKLINHKQHGKEMAGGLTTIPVLHT
jgi:hypothetical protein